MEAKGVFQDVEITSWTRISEVSEISMTLFTRRSSNPLKEAKNMKGKIVFTASVILLISTLGFFVFAQNQSGTNQIANGPYVPPKASLKEIVLIQAVTGPDGKMTGFRILPSPPLIKAVIRKDGSVDNFKTIPSPSSPSMVKDGNLRIERQDGSVQNIDLKTVKEIRIQP